MVRGQTARRAWGRERRLPAPWAALLAATLLLAPSAASGQEPAGDLRAPAGSLPDTASLARGPGSELTVLLERTIFRVDVLRLRLRLGPAAARQVAEGARGEASERARRRAVTRAVLEATDAWARIEFLRDISLERFLDATLSDLERARRAGLLSEPAADTVAAGLPRWFAFLAERRIRARDVLLYRIRGDTLRTVYVGRDGRVWLDQTDVGPERRLAVLGSWLAPGSSFRDGLLESALRAGASSAGTSRRRRPAGAPGPALRAPRGHGGERIQRRPVTASTGSRE